MDAGATKLRRRCMERAAAERLLPICAFPDYLSATRLKRQGIWRNAV